MSAVSLWHINDDGPQKLASSTIDLEHELEEWIERDPSLLEAGLYVVGRQVHVEAGPLDLLAVDSQGTWVVIELKRGALYRETLAQALDYAACIASMPHDQLVATVDAYLSKHSNGRDHMPGALIEELERGHDSSTSGRDVRVYLVGTLSDPGLVRLSSYLSGAYNVPITLVTYQVYQVGSGQRLLLRELTAPETLPPQEDERARVTVEDVCRRADAEGVGVPFRRILKAATSHGLYPRPYKTSVMYAPPSKRNRTLFTVWARQVRQAKPGALNVWIGPEIFAEFYPISQDEAKAVLGDLGWRAIMPDEVDVFIQRLDQLFERIEAVEGQAE